MPREPKKQEEAGEKNIEGAEKFARKEVEVEMSSDWIPRTTLGKKVLSGEVNDINKLFSEGIKIIEPEVLDILVPNLEKEIILIGGSTGKGGGIRRTPFRRTSRMHKSGRRYRVSVMVAVGNKNGYVGVGLASGPPGKNENVVDKALNKAKLNLIPVRRGCGSWECKCGTSHSIPFAVMGQAGSVRVKLMPAPKGVGLVVNDEVKKIMRLAGISDIWVKSRGQTSTRVNLIRAVYGALKKLDTYRTNPEFDEKVGLTIGSA